jgi:peptide/nickel transport system substrate-binding protein
MTHGFDVENDRRHARMLFCRTLLMKRLSRLAAALAVLAALSCGRAEKPATRTVLQRHLIGDPMNLDPTTNTEEPGVLVNAMIFRPLVGFDAKRQPVPSLAQSWTVSSDGLTYEFRLDPKSTWEGGAPVTSDDVRFTIERVRNPKVAAPTWRAAFEDVAAIETPDPATVRIRFSKPYAERMLNFAIPIVSAAAFGDGKSEAEIGRHPVGSGPYRLESWDSNQKLRVVRRDGAANADAHWDEIVFRVIPTGSVPYQAGLRGELDEFRLTRDETPTVEASAEYRQRFRTLKVPQFRQALLIWNLRNPFLADVRVRRALAHSWPREETAKRLYPPEGATLVAGPYPPGVPGNPPDLKPPTYDPAESARLLDEAGWKAGPDGIRRKAGKRASIEMLHPTGIQMYAAIGEILRDAYQQVGVELVLRPIEWAAFVERGQKGEFDVQFVGRIFFPPAVDPYPYFHSSQWPPGGENVGFYKNPEADRMMEAARVELDAAKRLDLYQQIARKLAEDQAADFLWDADQNWAMAKRVDGVEISQVGLFHFLPGPLNWRPASAVPK